MNSCFASILLALCVSEVFCFLSRDQSSRCLKSNLYLSTTTSSSAEQPCFWKPKAIGSKWQERIHIKDLKVGQQISGYVVEELLEGKTGPKVFFECGVGRTNKNGDWNIVNGMLRLDRWSKMSVSKKRAQRLRKKKEVELFVSRVQPECSRFEVVISEEKLEPYRDVPKTIPVSSLSKDDEVVGTVKRLCGYGAFVDVGANRLGLLHIQRVADLYGKYIDKEKGLTKSGLEVGAKVRLAVKSIDKRRLELDFTADVKNESEDEKREGSTTEETSSSTVGSNELEADEIAAWAAYASETAVEASESEEKEEDDAYDDDDDDDDYDNYDEEKDIEDALGLGFY